MSAGEARFHVDGPWGRIPVWVLTPRGRGPGVLVLHGLGADKDVQRRELESLAARGLVAVGVDAPAHGERREALVEEIMRAEQPQGFRLFLPLLRRWADELPAVAAHLRAKQVTQLGALGISMGAMALLAALPRLTEVRAAVSLLGTPRWQPAHGEVPADLAPRVAAEEPARHAAQYVGRSLLLINGGMDVNVPPAAARAFHAELLGLGATDVHYAEYALSTHFMCAEDWAHAWDRAVDFLAVRLGM